MTVRTRAHDYDIDRRTYRATVAWDDAVSGPRPGILVSHAWRGRSDFEDARAADLAGLGYTAFALDLYGKGVLGSSIEENAQLMKPFMEDRPMLQSRLRRAQEEMRGLDIVDAGKTGAIGFCFGGLCVLDLARTGADLAGVVSFHGLLKPPGNTEGTRIRAKVLVLHGWDDPMAPPDAALALAGELTAGGADWQLHAYGNTLHAFTNPVADDPEKGLRHDPVAARRAWRSMRDFFEDLFN